MPSCSRPATRQRERQDPRREVGHQRQVTDLRRGAGQPSRRRRRSSVWIHASNDRTSRRVVAGEPEPTPDRRCGRRWRRPTRGWPPPSRARAPRPPRSRSRRRSREQRGGARDDLLLVEVVDGRACRVLREQALLRGHVHDEVVRGEPVRRDDVERVVGQVVDHRPPGAPTTTGRRRSRDRRARPARAGSRVEHAVAHPTGRLERPRWRRATRRRSTAASASSARSGRSASTASIATVSSGSHASSAYAPSSSSTSVSG